MFRYGVLLDEILSLLNIEQYGLSGVLKNGSLVVTALREGAANVYTYDGERLIKQNKEPVSAVFEAKYGAERILIARDVGRGREQHKLFWIDPDRPGVEVEVPGVRPARILGAAYDGSKIVYSASTVEENAVYVNEDGESRKLAVLPGFIAILDVYRDKAVGIGAIKPETGRFSLVIIDLNSGNAESYEEQEGNISFARFTPEGQILYAVERSNDAILKVFDPVEGKTWEPEWYKGIYGKYEPVAFNFIGYTPKGAPIVVIRKDGRSKVFLGGEPLEGPEGIYGATYEWRESIVTVYTSLSTPPRIVQLTPDYSIVISGSIPTSVGKSLGKATFHHVESFDWEEVPVFVLESRRAPIPGPTVVLVHGGPFSEYADMWNIFAAALAVAGFHVVMPNYRGSTGYGDEWRIRIIGDPCGGELEDIIASARWALTRLASHVYIMGYSYGGYMTLCALTRKPGVFRAGVAGASVVDWQMMYEMSDAAFKAFIHMLFGGNTSIWKERSPLTYVESLNEPLMLVHPQNDTRTPLKPLLRFMEAAIEKGKSFEAYIAPDMGHAVNTVEDALKILWPALMFLVRMEERSLKL